MSLFRPIPATQKLPSICVFDLDHTLIGGDVTADWTPYLIKHELIRDLGAFLKVDEEMERRYHAGNLDIDDYLRQVVPFFGWLTMDALNEHVQRFIDEFIAHTVYQEGIDAIAQARALGIEVMIISASNAFLVKPVASQLFGIDEAYGVELAVRDNHLTADVIGIAPFQSGKIHCCKRAVAALGKTLDDVVFFTDSHNDLPLAHAAGDCICVNPDPILEKEAQRAGWAIKRWERQVGRNSQH